MTKIFLTTLLFIFTSSCATQLWDGNHYQATCRPQCEMATFVISQLPAKKYRTVLDIGCGSGDFTKNLILYANQVIGVDFSESMIEKAKLSYGHLKNLNFIVDDIRTLHNLSSTFDLILAFHPIQWIPKHDQASAFSHIEKLLNPGGICAILVSDRFNIFYQPLKIVSQQPTWSHYFNKDIEPWNWQTVESISSSFQQVNLRTLKVFVWNKQYHFASKKELFDFTANWLYNANHFNFIPESLHEEFFNQVMDTFLHSLGYSETSIDFESPFIVGIAEKHLV